MSIVLYAKPVVLKVFAAFLPFRAQVPSFLSPQKNKKTFFTLNLFQISQFLSHFPFCSLCWYGYDYKGHTIFIGPYTLYQDSQIPLVVIFPPFTFQILS